MSTVITTAGRPDDQSLQLALEASEILGYPIVERKKQAVSRIQNTNTFQMLLLRGKIDMICIVSEWKNRFSFILILQRSD